MNWISVKDELPNEKVDVLIYGKITCCGGLHYEQGYYKNKCWFGRMRDNYTHITVTHWMPLPEKPTE